MRPRLPPHIFTKCSRIGSSSLPPMTSMRPMLRSLLPRLDGKDPSCDDVPDGERLRVEHEQVGALVLGDLARVLQFQYACRVACGEGKGLLERQHLLANDGANLL